MNIKPNLHLRQYWAYKTEYDWFFRQSQILKERRARYSRWRSGCGKCLFSAITQVKYHCLRSVPGCVARTAERKTLQLIFSETVGIPDSVKLPTVLAQVFHSFPILQCALGQMPYCVGKNVCGQLSIFFFTPKLEVEKEKRDARTGRENRQTHNARWNKKSVNDAQLNTEKNVR